MSVEIEFDSSGFRELLYSQSLRNQLFNTAKRIKEEANASVEDSKGFGQYVKSGDFGGGRWIAGVYAKDDKATAAESERQVLSKAVHE